MHIRLSTLTYVLACFIAVCCVDVSAQVLWAAGPSGGDGGVEFDEHALPGPGLTLPAFGLRVSRIRICSGTFVDSIQFTWASGSTVITGQRHGGGGGVCRIHTLAGDERIISIRGRYGRVVDSIVITTNRHRTLPITAGGPGGAAPFSYEAPPDGSITALIGRSGDYLDAVGIIVGK
ncbi:MAG: hypothetical protein QOI24_4665 [Acidobacteriota bacterium]|jgi:hypothetical protein|nr:hypothetical protein [Acidobacteriota bacterium]